MQVTKTLFPVSGAYKSVQGLSAQMEKLQVQLATQQKASTLSELGNDRVFDLTLRSRLSRLDAFSTNINTTQLRLEFLNNSISRLDELESDVRGDLSASGVGSDGIYMATATQTAYSRLDEVLTILNGDLNGRYMFGGNVTDKKPVVTASVLLNGTGSKAGLKQIISERKLADFGGLTGLGRLDLDQIQLSASAGAANEAIISESATANGPVISGVTTTALNPASVTISPAGGTPGPASVVFADAPDLIADGEQVTMNVTQPNGDVEAYTFTAVTGTPANPGEFQIGVDGAETATNFLAAFSDHFHGNSVTLAEDGAHGFGIKLTGMQTTSAGISTFEQTATQPRVLQMRVVSQPQAGDTITINVTYPDNTEGQIVLTATTDSPPGDGEFEIGADVDATAANISAALTSQLENIRDTELSAASANKATEDLITLGGNPPRRVDGPPFETATGMIDGITEGPSANTVMWYTGQSTTGSARQTASARVDESTTAYYGVLGNEQGLADLVRASAVMAASTFSTSSTEDADRYQKLAIRQVTRLSDTNNAQSGAIEVIALELGLAQATVGSAEERHASYSAQLETMLSEIESVDINEVAMQLLTVRTNLEASYQTMSRLSELSLVNYMP